MTRLLVRSSGLLAACVVALTCATSVHATLTLTQNKLGNIFYTTETVTIPVAGTGTRIEWVITDFYGTTVKAGSANFTAGAAVISPNLGKRGFFEVLITEKDGTNIISTKTTTFAVLTPIDVATMADSRFGAMTHFAQTPRNETDLMPVLARAGIAHARDEQFWASVETTKGSYTYPSKFTGFMSAMSAQSIQPTLVLGWSNPFYDYSEGVYTTPYTTDPVNSPNGVGGYANYALAVLTRYGSQLKHVEVWNEYNAGSYAKLPVVDPPLSKPVTYFNMLKKTYETIKPVRPDVTVIAGGTVPVAHGFLNAVFAAGAMPYLDAVSVHPYIGAEDADLEFSELRNLIKQYNNNQEKPIWATEFSLSVTSLADQPEGARHAVRIGTQMLNQNVARMFYYPTANDDFFPARGLVGSKTDARGSYTPNPVYVSYAVFIRQLHGWTPAGRMAGTRSGTYVYKFTNGSSQCHVLWSTTPTTVHLNSPSANLSETDIMGTSATRTVTGGKLTLQLGANPVYITGTVNSVTEVFNPVVADSAAGYSKTQGQDGWTYGRASLASNAAYSTSNFVPMAWVIWQGDNYRWKGNDTYNFMTSRQAHPTGSWAIRRWTSTIAGAVTIGGELERDSTGGDGTRLRLFVDGVEKLNQFIAPGASLTYAVPNVTVAVGSKVDMAIVQEANSSNDATVATMRITRVLSSPIVLTQGGLTDYSVQTGTPATATVGTGGTSLTLTGNVWRKHPFTYTVTANTMLEFTVDAGNVGEILGIGLDSDDSYSNKKTTFQVGGSQNESNFLRTSQTYAADQGAVTYVIPVGAYFTGAVNHLTFVGDDDAGKAIDATFSNIRIYEAP